MRFQTLWQAKWILLVLLVFWGVVENFSPWWAILPAALIAFTLYFFRDPRRRIPDGPGLIVSPADGRITDIEEMKEKELTNQRMRRIGIFLSVFDVHVNRAPAEGRVIYTAAVDGTYHDARSPRASGHNTARTWGFDCHGTTLVVRQITGAIARRIVPWAMLGDQLKRGQHFGMIRFGSRTEIFLPLEAEMKTMVGEQVMAGATVLAQIRQRDQATTQPAEEKVIG